MLYQPNIPGINSAWSLRITFLYIDLELFDLVKTILKKKNKVGRLIPGLTISYSNQDCGIGIRIDI